MTYPQISLLREFRTRLIADVVTGKLDVREAAINLPELLDESEEADEDLANEALEDNGDEDTSEADEAA